MAVHPTKVAEADLEVGMASALDARSPPGEAAGCAGPGPSAHCSKREAMPYGAQHCCLLEPPNYHGSVERSHASEPTNGNCSFLLKERSLGSITNGHALVIANTSTSWSKVRRSRDTMASHSLALGFVALLVQITAAVAAPRAVTHLPGFHGPLPFSLQTGYVEVDDSNGVRLFYYFVQSERSPKDDPVLLWLTGGPGCSAFSGLVYEIGPLSFQPHSYTGGLPKLVYRPDSWTKVANIIFLDSPVGAGFSYSVRDDGYKSCDTKAINQITIFLSKWYKEHQQFILNPLYIAGDSYSGLIVPPLVFEIGRGIEMGDKSIPNLKGYLIGNPLTDGKFDLPSKVPYAHRMGLISDEQYEIYSKICGTDTSINQSVQCANCLDAIDKCLKGINIHHILEPECSSAYNENSGRSRMMLEDSTSKLHLSEISSECREKGYAMSSIWANNDTVRQALGTHKGTVPLWLRCNHGTPYTSDIRSSVEYHRSVTTGGYRSLIYSGDHDMTVPFIGTQAWIRSLGFSVVDEWRPWHVTGQVAGFTRLYSNNLTFATVKGGGHTAPEYMPKECLAMVARWLSDQPI